VSGANGKLTDQQVEAELADLAAGRNVPSDGDGQAGHTARTLRVRSIREVLDELQTAGQRTWLSQRLWPGDAYGVLGAQDKAGKTWGLLDLAVSVASGTPWLGRFPCPAPGPVTLFLGEGGMPGTVRRLRAVTEHKGLDLAELALRLEFKAPNLGRAEHLRFIAEELAAHPPRLLGLDPSYLTTGGRSGTNLNEMGELLASVQALCEDAAAALVVNVHWNKTGTGTGAERFTGVGPSAWGRVLGSASVEQSSTEADGKTSNVTLGWEFKGGEIADATFRMRRRVWADDPDDLNSPLHYQAEVTTEGPHRPMSDSQDGDGLGFAQRRVVAAMRKGGKLLRVQAIGDQIAEDGQGRPLKAQTIRNALQGLEKLGWVEATEEAPGLPRHWSLTKAAGDLPDPPDPPRGEGGEGTFPTLPTP
jgi:AAA domain